jgi:hypothetical protein
MERCISKYPGSAIRPAFYFMQDSRGMPLDGHEECVTLTTMERTLSAWPDWLGQLDPQMRALLVSLDQHREWLASSCEESHIYKRLGQAQIRQFEELGRKSGAYKQYVDGKRTNFDILKKMQMPQALLRAMAFNVSQRHHTLEAYRYAKKITSQKLLEEIPVAMQTGDFFAGFAAMKALYENLGDMTQMIKMLSEVKPGSDAHMTGERYDAILNKELASGIDWIKLSKVDLRQVEDLRSVSSAPDSKRDDELMALKAVSSLGRRLKSVPAAYAVLNEFGRPRVGTLWLVYEDSQSMQDGHKTQWNRNKLGPGFPRIMVEQMKPVIVQLFGVLNDALGLLQLLDKEFIDADAKIAGVSRDETRTWLWMFPDMFDKHEDCPCGSGKRVKYCCGQ